MNYNQLWDLFAHLYHVSINSQLFPNNYHCILLNYTSGLQQQDLLHYLLVLFISGFTVSNRCSIFKYYLFIICIYLYCCCVYPWLTREMVLFWRYISFFKYFCFTFNCPRVILWWVSRDFQNITSNFISSQINSCFCGFLNCFFWISFNCISSQLFSMIRKFLAVWYVLLKILLIFLLTFCSNSSQKTKIHNLLQIFDP